MSNGKIVSGDELKRLLIDAMRRGHISVWVAPNGQMREYQFFLQDDRCVLLRWDYLNMCCIYTIEIEDVEVVSVSIPHNHQIFSPEEKMVMDIFRVCSAQIILQEQLINFNSFMYRHRSAKNYSN